MDQSPRQALENLIGDWAKESINTILIGIVHAYDPIKQRADICPQVMDRRYNEAGDPVDERLPIIPNVPVGFYGSGKFEHGFDIEVGDRLLILCSKYNLDNVLAEDVESVGSFQRQFHLKDALALPFAFRSDKNPRVPFAKGTMRLGAVDGPQITCGLDGTMAISALTELDLLGQGGVAIHSDCAVTIQERVVDPIGGHDI
jgi:hypothetical protein